jgi:hypothetical protein
LEEIAGMYWTIPLSPHYNDQAEIYNAGNFRKMMLNKEEIVKLQQNWFLSLVKLRF